MNMRTLVVLPAMLALLLAACGGKEPATDTAPAATTEAAAPVADATVADEPAVDPAAQPAADGAATPATDPAAAATPDATPAATPVPSADPAPVAGLTLGRDYEIIRGADSFEPLNGKIEVVEVFSYVCPACAMFQPLVNSWKPRLGADVRFTYVPAAFGPRWDPYARAFYAAESLGIADRTHDAVFKAIHVDRSLKGERGDDKPEDIAKIYAAHGVDAKQFTSTMASFAVTAKVNRSRQFIERVNANSTPQLIVNGKYRVRGQSWDDMLRIADVLIAHERAAAR